MQQLIAKIGKGQKGAKDLTWEEAKLAMRLILEGQATPVQVGAFLMAMRIKMETVSELAAFTATARGYVPPLEGLSDLGLIDLPIYGEKHETFHAIIAAAILASAADAPILIHGCEHAAAPSDVARVLKHLGISVDLDRTRVIDELSAKRFAYLDMALYHPPLARLLGLRQELGVQNLFYQVVRMLDPARASSRVIGIAHPPYLDKMAEALSMLGCQRALILQGVEGCPELSIATVTTMRELRQNRITPLQMTHKDAGLPVGSFRDMAGFSATATASAPEQQATLIHRILDNNVQGGQRNWVILNAAMLLYMAGKASSLSAAVPLVQHLLESGAASRKLADLSNPGVCAEPSHVQLETVQS